MKKYFLKRKKQLNKAIEETRDRIQNSTDANEVRELGPTLQGLMDELAEVDAKLAELDDQDQAGDDQQQDQADNSRGVNPMHEFRNRGTYNTQQRQQQTDDPYDTVEYRTAFMNFICRGTAIPMNLREAGTTTISDTSAVVPTSILHEIVKEMRGYGEIWNRVRKLNIQGGVQVPIITLFPEANWVGEGKSEDQKIGANENVMFSYHGLECKIAQSLLVNVTTLDVFQQEFTVLAAEAIVEKLEISIFTGDGNGKCLGVLNDARVPAANKITMTDEEFNSWSGWKKKVFAKMKKKYRKGAFTMAQGTFDGYIDGMVDQNGQPIGRVNYGTAGAETYRFGGKEVLTVEENVLPAYENANSGDVVAVFVDWSKYGVNSNMQLTVVKWTDHDNNVVKNKAIMIVDGKLIDAAGCLLIKKA